MSNNSWESEFRAVHARAVAAWRNGRRSVQSLLESGDLRFLDKVGCSAQELFDFVDDLMAWGEPDLETVLAVQGVRRSYFLEEMGGQSSGKTGSMAALPSKSAAVDGIVWLPRLIVKARWKLRGEMPAELMYGCGGDRPFLRRMGMTLESFLRLVWECGEDDARIVAAVQSAAARRVRA